MQMGLGSNLSPYPRLHLLHSLPLHLCIILRWSFHHRQHDGERSRGGGPTFFLILAGDHSSNSSTTVASSSSSTSNTVGFTPRPNSSRITTWHMQHPRLPNTITAFSDTIFVTQVTSFIPTPGFMGPSLGSIVALDGPAELPPPVVGTHVRYGSAWCMATIQTTEREQKEREERERGESGGSGPWGRGVVISWGRLRRP